MATSGRVETGRRNNTCFYMQWQLAGQNIGANYSTVNWQGGINMNASTWWYSNSVRIHSLYVNGANKASGLWSNFSGTGDRQLVSGSHDIGHNADGGKSFTGTIHGWLYGNGDLDTAGTWDLPTIPRGADPTTNKSSYNLGESITVYTNRKSSSFTHTVRFERASGGMSFGDDTNVGAQVTRTLTNAQITNIQNAIPNQNNFDMQIAVYNNQVGEWRRITRQLYIIDANPEFANFEYADTASAIVAITGNDQILVQGKSTLRSRVTPANKMNAIKGANPANYTATIDGNVNTQAYSASANVDFPLGAVSGSGSRVLSVRAIDSRGNSTTVNKTITVIPYASPVLNVTAERLNNFENQTTIKIDGTFSRLTIGGSDKNNIVASSVRYRTRQDGGAWSGWTTRTFTQGAGAFDAPEFYISLLNSSMWDIQVEVKDKLETVTNTITVDRGIPLLMLSDNKEALGVNTMPDGNRPGIYVVPGIDKIFDYIYPIGTVYENVTPTNPSAFFGGTWVSFGTGRVTVGVDASQSEFNTVEKTGGHKLLQEHDHRMGSEFGTTSNLNSGENSAYSQTDGRASPVRTNHTTRKTGGGNSQNLQPYITVYRWKRTA